jgi:hypothetical protein
MIDVGRRPVLVLWGTIVAERLGFERDEALTLGRAVASLGGRVASAQAEGLTAAKVAEMRANLRLGQSVEVSLLGRAVCVANVAEGLRAVLKIRPIDPVSVELYLGEKFGDQINTVAEAMISLAEALPPSLLAECASDLYEQFQPETSGLDIERINAIARSHPQDEAVAGDERLSESWLEDAHAEMPSFRGPQVMRSRLEPIRRERRADIAPTYRAPADFADSSSIKMHRCAIKPPSSPVAIVAAVSAVPWPRLTHAVPARRSMSPFVLMLAVAFAGVVGGGIGAVLVAPPRHTGLMAELQGLLASHRQTSSSLSRTFEAEPMPGAYSDASAGAPRREPVAAESSALLPPVDSHGAFAVTATERDSEAADAEPIVGEMSLPVAAAMAGVVAPSNTEDATPEHLPVDGNTVPEITRIDASDDAPGNERAALDNSPPVAAAAVVSLSSTENVTPKHSAIDSQGASEVARIAMERGDERMRQGDVVAARRFYEMAASAGMIQAATAMGRTFDPLYLKHIRVRGALADAQRAKQWYENAAKAGDMEALARIELMTWNSSHR